MALGCQTALDNLDISGNCCSFRNWNHHPWKWRINSTCGIWPAQTTMLGMGVLAKFKQTMVKLILCLALLLAPIAQACGQTPGGSVADNSKSDQSDGDTDNGNALRDVLPPEQWKRVDAS